MHNSYLLVRILQADTSTVTYFALLCLYAVTNGVTSKAYRPSLFLQYSELSLVFFFTNLVSFGL